jgi:exopolyphosphatase/guanosine-5'-triphosphate,3'-diphosphate pyrophosphatase
MQAAEMAPGGSMKLLASARQVTRLGESVFRSGQISEEAIETACTTLESMAEQYKRLSVAGIRAVATSAVRDARNQAEFLERASKAAGTPVEVISGREEARLIHLGVLARWQEPLHRALMIDIGGGSAEIILSDGGMLRDAVSRPLGAVRLTEIFLKADPPSPRELHQMREFIEEKLAGTLDRFGQGPWQRVIATSATASAIVCAIHRVPRAKRDTVNGLRASRAQVRDLYRKVSDRTLAARRKMVGIGPRRAEIIVAGVGVLLSILEELRVPSVYYSAAGVRDGIIADLAARGVGRELTRLTRDQRKEVEQMCRRYGVSLRHAKKVAEMAQSLFAGAQPLHRLQPNYGRLLEAAAYLHDVGHYVSDTSHHKHSYYLVANSDMPGFTNRERELIANLCRYHRKALPASAHATFQALPAEEKSAVLFLIPLLRLADNLDRSNEQRITGIECSVKDDQFTLRLTSDEDIDLEQWATEREAENFRQVYNRTLTVVQAHARPGLSRTGTI